MKVNAKYVVFSMIAVASTYVLYHNERFLADQTNPIWQHYEPFKWWLLPHGIFGAIVLLFAPFQFSDRLRQRFTKAHRVMGRMYVLGAFGLAPLGAYIQYFQERFGAPRSFTLRQRARRSSGVISVSRRFFQTGRMSRSKIARRIERVLSAIRASFNQRLPKAPKF